MNSAVLAAAELIRVGPSWDAADAPDDRLPVAHRQFERAVPR